MAAREYIYLGSYIILKRSGSHPFIWSAADEVNTLCMGAWAFTWVKYHPDQLEEKRLELGLTPKLFSELRNWATSAFDNESIGWADCFCTPKIAFAFRDLFFADRTDVAIISLFVANEIASEMAEAVATGVEKNIEKSGHEVILGKSGHEVILGKSIPESAVQSGKLLGFDVIGLDFGCLVSFHSERYRFPEIAMLNEFGLIADEEMAHAFADAAYTSGRAIDGVGSIAVKVVRHSK